MRVAWYLLLVILAVLGVWGGLSLLGPSEAPKYPLGGEVMHLNRIAGEWLALRSFPRPECESREAAASSVDAFKMGAIDGEIAEMYSWTDSKTGEVHYTDDPQDVPERQRAGSRVESLPKLEVYRGAFSKVKASLDSVKPIAPRRPAAGGNQVRAVVYSAEWCGACKSTKALLVELGVVVEERDIDKDPRALQELVGIAGNEAAIPVTLIGKKVIGGFAQDELRAAVAAAKSK
jgi:glutaredoxin